MNKGKRKGAGPSLCPGPMPQGVSYVQVSRLGALGVWSSKESNPNERLVYIFIAGIFTAMAALDWYALAFVVRPFG